MDEFLDTFEMDDGKILGIDELIKSYNSHIEKDKGLKAEKLNRVSPCEEVGYQREIAELKKALKEIRDCQKGGYTANILYCMNIAKQALKE